MIEDTRHIVVGKIWYEEKHCEKEMLLNPEQVQFLLKALKEYDHEVVKPILKVGEGYPLYYIQLLDRLGREVMYLKVYYGYLFRDDEKYFYLLEEGQKVSIASYLEDYLEEVEENSNQRMLPFILTANSRNETPVLFCDYPKHNNQVKVHMEILEEV